MTLPAHSSIIRIQMQSCPHYPLQLEYRAREYRRMQGINYEALNALSPTRPQLSLFWQSPVCVVWTQFGCSCFACNRKTSLESQDTKYMKEWQKVVAEMYWMFMYKIYAKVAAMDVMRQGLRLYQHRAAPHPQLPLYLYRATHQYSQHTFFCQLLKKRESYFPYSYFLFVFRFKKNKIDLDIPVNDWCDQGHNSWFADKIELGNSRVWVEPVVQLTDADFCKIFNRESQLGREEGGDSPFWKVKEDFEDLGFRLFGLACRHICQTHISVFTSQSHAGRDHSRIILRHWQFHNFSALADSLDEPDSTLTVSQYFIVVLYANTFSATYDRCSLALVVGHWWSVP